MAKDDKQGLRGKFTATDAGNSPFHNEDGVGAAHEREAEQVSEDLSRERISAMSGTDINTRIERVAGTRREAAQDNLERRAKQSFNDQIFFAMLQQNVAALEAAVANIEDGLRARYGENFAEVIAEKYLDKETAERRPGETDEEYRARIAKEIQKKIETGAIDPDDPLVREWAKTRRDLHAARDQERAYIAENAEALAASGELKQKKSADVAHAEKDVAGAAKDDVQDAFVENSETEKDAGADNQFGALFAENSVSITAPSQPTTPTGTPTPESPQIS